MVAFYFLDYYAEIPNERRITLEIFEFNVIEDFWDTKESLSSSVLDHLKN